MSEIQEITIKEGLTPGQEKLQKLFKNNKTPGEGRFDSPIGKSLAESSLHIPDTEPDNYKDGSTSSWPSKMTNWLKAKWNNWKERVNEDPSGVQKEILETAQSQVRTLAEKFSVSEGQVLSFASGSAAIVALKGIFGRNGQLTVATKETGSDIKKSLSKEGFFELDLRDAENNLIPEEKIVETFKAKIDANPDAYFVLTLSSKTGNLYAKATQEILDYLVTLDKKAVVDAIQANGRFPKDQTTKWLKHEACLAVVVSGSKAFEASAHAGFAVLSSSGLELAKTNINSENAQTLVGQHGAFGKLLDSHEVSYDEIPASLIRIADNAHAIAEDIDKGLLYSDKAREYRKVYEDFFTDAGFKILEKDKEEKSISIISMELPGANIDEIENFLSELAKNGISLGGKIQEAGTNPIFRFTLSIDLLKDPNIDKEKLVKLLNENLKPIFDKAINKVK